MYNVPLPISAAALAVRGVRWITDCSPQLVAETVVVAELAVSVTSPMALERPMNKSRMARTIWVVSRSPWGGK